MPNENDTEASPKDALNAYESLFVYDTPTPAAVVVEEQEATDKTDREPQGLDIGEQTGGDESGPGENEASGDESGPAEDPASEGKGVPADSPTSEGESSPAEDLKVVVSIREGRASIGVQQPASDPYIESFDDRGLSELAQEVPAVLERARARWEDAPKHPAYERPATPTERRPRRNQRSAQASTAEGEAAQQQPQAPRLF